MIMTTATQKIPLGYKLTELGIIPEDWDVKKLGDIAHVTKLAGFEYSNYFNSYKDGGEIIVLRGTNITHNKLDLSDTRNIPRSTSNKLPRSKLSKDDLVFAYVGTIGPVFLIDKDDSYHLGPNTCKITAQGCLVPTFAFVYFNSWFIKNEIIEHTSVGAQPSLSMSKIRKFRIILPSSEVEQTAIATVLSDTDALIENLEKLVAKKKAIKQGTMQQLLTGKKRLPGFSGEWEVKMLGDVCEIKKGQLITEKTRVDGIVPVIAGGKTPAYFHNKANRHGKTITISASGASAGYVAFYNTPIFASDCSTIEESSNYSIAYIYFVLQLLQEKIYKMQTGGAQPHVHSNDINPIPLLMPALNEQNTIATILSDMDTEIEKLESQLVKYQNIKQGMMQQLLPGKIRIYANA